MDAHSPLIEPPGRRTRPRSPRCLAAVCSLLLSIFASPLHGWAQQPDVALSGERAGPHVTATRIEDPPVVDGRLDEPVWGSAAVIDDFRVPEPVEGDPLPERTEVRILYDETAIYFGFRCFERDPDAVSASVLRRDAIQITDDRIIILLDTFHERRTGYGFEVNPNGARWDSLIEEGGGLNREWDGIWYASARRDAEGWTVEVAIPMKTLNFPEGGTTWGLQLGRAITRLNQLGRWANAAQNVFLFDVAHFGEVNGLHDLEQGIGLDVVPAMAIRQVRNNEEGWVSDEGDPIIDVFYKITPSLTNVLTSNTDFSDAEPDRRIANLTRFSLFFPEQRDFFLQDAGIFN
ncbi:MAG: carbohydrate binding family 9 domain-containing protein, partial [Myxococcota bacterium]